MDVFRGHPPRWRGLLFGRFIEKPRFLQAVRFGRAAFLYHFTCKGSMGNGRKIEALWI